MATEPDKRDVTAEQQTSSNNDIEEHVDLRIRKRDKKRKIVIYVEDESDDNDETPLTFLTGGAPHINRYAHEILDHGRSTVQVKPGGAILITPHPCDLPSEIVSMIVQHISYQGDRYSLSLVNKQFHSIVNPLLWKSPTLFHRKAERLFLSGLLAHVQADPTTSPGRHIEKLLLMGEYWTDTKFSLLLPHIRHVKDLAIHAKTRITHASVIHVPRHCPQLTHVFLCEEKTISEQAVLRLAQHCPQLCSLKLILCPRLSDDVFIALGQRCPLLEEFSVMFMDPTASWTQGIIQAIRQWPKIKTLEIHAIPSGLVPELLSTSASLAWPQLQSLSIGDCSDVTNTTTWWPFFQSHPHLSKLQIDHCGDHLLMFEDDDADNNMDYISVNIMAAALPCLSELNLRYHYSITSQSLWRLIVQCPRLSLLSTYHCHLVSAADFPCAAAPIQDLVEVKADGMDRIRRACAIGRRSN
ncbi:unnamed protein product [Absidia cylindrospora]